MKRLHVVFEGAQGSGKTTMQRAVFDLLKATGFRRWLAYRLLGIKIPFVVTSLEMDDHDETVLIIQMESK